MTSTHKHSASQQRTHQSWSWKDCLSSSGPQGCNSSRPHSVFHLEVVLCNHMFSPSSPLPLCFGFCRSSEGGREKEERSHSLGAELWLEKKLKNTNWVLKVKLNTLYVYIHYMDSRPSLPIANAHGPRHGLSHGY